MVMVVENENPDGHRWRYLIRMSRRTTRSPQFRSRTLRWVRMRARPRSTHLPGIRHSGECSIRMLHSPVWRMPGKWVLRGLARILTQRKVRDLNCGLRVVRRDILMRYLHLCPSGFSFSTTITMALVSRGYGVEFVPI